MWEDQWKEMLKLVLSSKLLVKKEEKRNRDFQEIISHSFTLNDPIDRLISDKLRAMNIFQCVGHFLWITQGNFNLNSIRYYQPRAEKHSSDKVKMIGAYGPRLFGVHHLNQIGHVKDVLDKDSTKRKAVASIYLPQFDQHEKSDEIPCTLNLQYLIRNNELHAVTYMRSQDAFNVLPYDVFLFTMLQEYLTALLSPKFDDLKVGCYHHFSGSFHVYSKNKEFAEKCLDTKPEINEQMEPMPFEDAEIELRNLNKFETLLRNTVVAYKERSTKINFDFYFKMIEESFHYDYWKQLALILLYFGALNTKDDSTLTTVMGKLHPFYRYYVKLHVEKSH